MAANAKSPAAVLTRKLGPAPVWVWAVSAIVVYALVQRFRGASSSTATTPATDAGGGGGLVDSSGNVAGGSGGGSAAGQLSADQLSALTGTKDSYNSYEYVFSPTDSHNIDYGSGNTFPPSGGTGSGPPPPPGPTPPPPPTPPPVGTLPTAYDQSLANLWTGFNASQAAGGAVQTLPGGGTIQWNPNFVPTPATGTAPIYTPPPAHAVGYGIGSSKPTILPGD